MLTIVNLPAGLEVFSLNINALVWQSSLVGPGNSSELTWQASVLLWLLLVLLYVLVLLWPNLLNRLDLSVSWCRGSCGASVLPSSTSASPSVSTPGHWRKHGRNLMFIYGHTAWWPSLSFRGQVYTHTYTWRIVFKKAYHILSTVWLYDLQNVFR